jgi:hypothetical protein
MSVNGITAIEFSEGAATAGAEDTTVTGSSWLELTDPRNRYPRFGTVSM